MHATIIPFGLTQDTVNALIESVYLEDARVVLLVTIKDRNPGIVETKREILEDAVKLAGRLGKEVRSYWAVPWTTELHKWIHETLLEIKPEKVTLSGVTGSRYLQPLITQALLAHKTYCRPTIRLQLLHGIEGGPWRVEPLDGYYSLPRLGRREQLVLVTLERLLEGGSPPAVEEIVSGLGNIMSRGSGGSSAKTVYKVLSSLRRKGLVSRDPVGRGYVLTMPGRGLATILEDILEKGCG